MRRAFVLILAVTYALPAAASAYDAVDCVPGTCWASGPAGAVAVLAR